MENISLGEFQQKLWENWRQQDLSHLSGEKEGKPWELIDNHYYPLYGLGNSDSDVMVVAAGPAWNVGEGAKFPDKRDKSWECNDFEWTPDIDRDSFEEQERIWRLNRLKERNELVRTLIKLVKFSNELEIGETNGLEDPFQSLYYTNFKKDGEFDDSDLDRMSENFWRDYLVREIELQDPSIILTLGKPASENIREICGGEPLFELLGAVDNLSPIVVQSYHWSNLHNNYSNVDESTLPNEITNRIGKLSGTDDYWRVAAMQIDRFL